MEVQDVTALTVATEGGKGVGNGGRGFEIGHERKDGKLYDFENLMNSTG